LTVENHIAHAQTPYDVSIWIWDETIGWLTENITMDGIETGFNSPHTFTGLTGTHTFTVSDINGWDNPFTKWDTGELDPTIALSSGGTHTAQYYNPITITIAAWDNVYGLALNEPITMNGFTSGYLTPKEFTNLIPYRNVFKVPDTDIHGNTFSKWNTDETSTSIKPTSSGTYTAQYSTPTPPLTPTPTSTTTPTPTATPPGPTPRPTATPQQTNAPTNILPPEVYYAIAGAAVAIAAIAGIVIVLLKRQKK